MCRFSDKALSVPGMNRVASDYSLSASWHGSVGAAAPAGPLRAAGEEHWRLEVPWSSGAEDRGSGGARERRSPAATPLQECMSVSHLKTSKCL